MHAVRSFAPTTQVMFVAERLCPTPRGGKPLKGGQAPPCLFMTYGPPASLAWAHPVLPLSGAEAEIPGMLPSHKTAA